MGKNILITGITGFVGNNLYEGTLNDYSIIGVDLLNRKLPDRDIYAWSDFAKLPSSEIIIHLAGLAHEIKKRNYIGDYFEVNVGLTKKVYRYFLESEAVKFVFFSSVKAVADSVDGKMLTEMYKPDPQSAYGQSKLAAEQYILDQKLPPGKKVYILRPCMIHGPGNKGNLNLLYNIVKKGIPYPLGAFHNLRSFTSIENLVFIIREIIERDIEPGIYNVADDQPVSTNEIVELISASLNRNPLIWKVPKGIVKGMSKIGDFMGFPLNSERFKQLTESYIVSNIKLKSALGVNRMPIFARDGLRHTFDSFPK